MRNWGSFHFGFWPAVLWYWERGPNCRANLRVGSAAPSCLGTIYSGSLNDYLNVICSSLITVLYTAKRARIRLHTKGQRLPTPFVDVRYGRRQR